MISPGDVINKIAENEGITVSALATSLVTAYIGYGEVPKIVFVFCVHY